jgi:hypothetical protein
MFVHITGAAFPEGNFALLPDGPSEEEERCKPCQGSGRGDQSGRLRCLHDDRYGEWIFLHASGGARGGELP